MKRLVASMALVAALAGLLIGATAGLSSASWVSNNCYVSNAEDDHYRRLDARAYADIGIGEGYEWGGGCWNNNNVDDTPGQPDSSGEGPDCSGFTFKTWELETNWGASGFHWWNRMQNIHGPYAAATYHSPGSNLPFYQLADKTYQRTLYMDAFASSTHVGMIHSDTIPSTGDDYIIEAKGDAYGIDVWVRNYRSDSAYTGVRRRAWTPDCYPRCGLVAADSTVVIA